jgi:hypothetical protein
VWACGAWRPTPPPCKRHHNIGPYAKWKYQKQRSLDTGARSNVCQHT